MTMEDTNAWLNRIQKAKSWEELKQLHREAEGPSLVWDPAGKQQVFEAIGYTYQRFRNTQG